MAQDARRVFARIDFHLQAEEGMRQRDALRAIARGEDLLQGLRRQWLMVDEGHIVRIAVGRPGAGARQVEGVGDQVAQHQFGHRLLRAQRHILQQCT
ncbi:hypothetical protein ACHMW6_02610 [Pseudoduganella sp. UC29_106]|uniref:hypothetical protein n=1 Tax=Pseudoduganella sp. UC29_106 TaxID=3374553 RepID=UPI003756D8CC